MHEKTLKMALAAAALVSGCAAARQENAASAPPAEENPAAAMPVAATPPAAPKRLALVGPRTQGGLLFGQTIPRAQVTLDEAPVMVGPDGRFAIGFARDHGPTATLKATYPDGSVQSETIAVAAREFPIERIDGVDQSKVSGFTPEQLAKIEADGAKKKAARVATSSEAFWSDGFAWPAQGRVSGVYGSQRILNGEPKTPHSGMDLAAPAGTPIKAPAAGIVRLAEPDMYFEGGLVLIYHGHWVESAFMHMSRIDVKVGQQINRGDVIGLVGATGRATGPHLHWSLKWTTHLVDPQLLLDPAANPLWNAPKKSAAASETPQPPAQ